MTTARRAIMWLVLLLILLLIIFSIYGAFIGTSRAASFFNTLPLAIYWIFFAVLLVIGIGTFKKLYRRPGLLLIHLGCIGVLLGGMLGSDAGHRLKRRILGIDKLRQGRMVIYEKMSENRVLREGADIGIGMDRDGTVVFYEAHDRQHAPIKGEDGRIFSLPFDIKLNDFRMEYYDTPRLTVRSEDGRAYALDPVEVGERFKLPDNTVITIVQKFGNLKLRMDKGGYVAYDDKGPGLNPAIKTRVQYADGTKEEQFAFANFSGEMGRKRRLSMRLANVGMVRDYFSDLQVIRDGEVVLTKTIQVNDPLHYGGYHFYQSAYDDREERYTVLSVMSDSGLYIVYAGLWVMGIGVMWNMWLRPVMSYLNKRKTSA